MVTQTASGVSEGMDSVDVERSVKAGVGYSDNTGSGQAGRLAAEAAMQDAGITSADLVILFANSRHDSVALLDGVRSVVGPDARLIGGSASGVITNDSLGYDGYQVGVGVLKSDRLSIDLFVETGLNDNEEATGVALAQQIAAQDYQGQPSIVLLYDWVKQLAHAGPPALNFATPLLAGFASVLNPLPALAGAGLLGDGTFQLPNVQWIDDRIEQQSAMALVLSGGVRMDTLILHGCKPSSSYHTITETSGNMILQIDDRPALDVIDDLVGRNSGLVWEEYPLFVTLGVNKGDKFDEFSEDNYANRLCFAISREHRALIMFEPDLKPGDEVQLMRRSIGLDYIGQRINQHLESLGAVRPFFALYIDCLGRAGAYSNMDQEEAEAVQKQIGMDIPLLGMYSGVEIARVGPDVQALDWTGVLCLFSE